MITCNRCQQEMVTNSNVHAKPDGKLYRFCVLCKSDNYLSCYKCPSGYATVIVTDGGKTEYACAHHAVGAESTTRVESVEEGFVPQPNETVIDSALDLANYAIFTAMFEHGECDFTDDEDFFAHFDDALVALRNIVVERRKKYGPGNLVIHGARGTVVRASDKVSRLNNFYFKTS